MSPLNPEIALVALVGLLAAVLLVGALLGRRGARVRTVTAEEPVDPAELGARQLGDAGTVVQFSTEYCARCPGTEKLLAELVRGEPGISFVHVDVTRDPELTRKYQLLQTPTVLFIDATGRPRARVSGTVSRTVLSQELQLLTGGAR